MDDNVYKNESTAIPVVSVMISYTGWFVHATLWKVAHIYKPSLGKRQYQNWSVQFRVAIGAAPMQYSIVKDEHIASFETRHYWTPQSLSGFRQQHHGC